MIDPRESDQVATRAGATPHPQTLEYLLELARSAPQAQAEQSDKFDGKTVNVFGAATVILALIASRSSSIHPSHNVLVAAILVYLVAAAATIAGLWVRRLRVIDDPRTLWTNLYDVDVHTARLAIMDDLVDGYGKNVRTLRWKKATLSIALVATGVEVLLIAFAALG
jgi:hypothetical protein